MSAFFFYTVEMHLVGKRSEYDIVTVTLRGSEWGSPQPIRCLRCVVSSPVGSESSAENGFWCMSGSSFSFVNDDEFYVNIYNIHIYLQQ